MKKQKLGIKVFIVVIIALFVCIILIKILKIKTFPSAGKNNATKQLISQITLATSMYKEQHDYYPIIEHKYIAIEDLTIKDDSVFSIAEIKEYTKNINGKKYFIDEFGNQIIYKCPGEKNRMTVDIISAGEDGQFDTEDDLTN